MPGGLWEVVLSFKFRHNRLNGFRDMGGGRKLPFPIHKASGLYNSLYYRTSRDINLFSHGANIYINTDSQQEEETKCSKMELMLKTNI